MTVLSQKWWIIEGPGRPRLPIQLAYNFIILARLQTQLSAEETVVNLNWHRRRVDFERRRHQACAQVGEGFLCPNSWSHDGQDFYLSQNGSSVCAEQIPDAGWDFDVPITCPKASYFDDINGSTFTAIANDERCYTVVVGQSIEQSSELDSGCDIGGGTRVRLGNYTQTIGHEQHYRSGDGTCYNGLGRESGLTMSYGGNTTITVNESPTCYYSVHLQVQAVDTPGWTNNAGYDCVGYEAAGWCVNGGFAPGLEWTGKPGMQNEQCGAEYADCASRFNFPAHNCVACGKGTTQVAPTTTITTTVAPTTTITTTVASTSTVSTTCSPGKLMLLGNRSCNLQQDLVRTHMKTTQQLANYLCLTSCELDPLCMSLEMIAVDVDDWECNLLSGVVENLESAPTEPGTSAVCYGKKLCYNTTHNTTVTIGYNTTRNTTVTVTSTLAAPPMCELSQLGLVGNFSCNCIANDRQLVAVNLLDVHCIGICNEDPACVAADLASSNGVRHDCMHYYGDQYNLCDEEDSSDASDVGVACFKKAGCRTTTTKTTTTCILELDFIGYGCCDTGDLSEILPLMSLSETDCVRECNNDPACFAADMRYPEAIHNNVTDAGNPSYGVTTQFRCKRFGGQGPVVGCDISVDGRCYSKRVCKMTTTTTTWTSTTTPCSLMFLGSGCCNATIHGLDAIVGSENISECRSLCEGDLMCLAFDHRNTIHDQDVPEWARGQTCMRYAGITPYFALGCNDRAPADVCYWKHCGATTTQTTTTSSWIAFMQLQPDEYRSNARQSSTLAIVRTLTLVIGTASFSLQCRF